ncbi:YbaB/EbfC family nucleoid-associated protein [Candidatus Aquarickettsia rohweri]|uniref:Nucleoid-associated protein EIC27_06230 n=1 Tax=Candidatus Aquarickettsia rohweri TaxID=2602574 RepID=A0A3S0FL04_9RICK|nr:YbaB/EbfC family nucleoid-associated protein [Candidatus Aquarickettsia rohweri]RST62516.1 YbaB/EbfC family nucleoid-associated protein [Candidatus Aquarickettsia rohweri]
MNIQQMMKQAQSMQKKMQEVQKKMDDIEVTGTAGGGAVTIITTGKGEVKKVKIDKSIVNPDDTEIIEDLIVAAFNNAKQNAEQTSNEEMSKLGISPDILKGMM